MASVYVFFFHVYRHADRGVCICQEPERAVARPGQVSYLPYRQVKISSCTSFRRRLYRFPGRLENAHGDRFWLYQKPDARSPRFSVPGPDLRAVGFFPKSGHQIVCKNVRRRLWAVGRNGGRMQSDSAEGNADRRLRDYSGATSRAAAACSRINKDVRPPRTNRSGARSGVNCGGGGHHAGGYGGDGDDCGATDIWRQD